MTAVEEAMRVALSGANHRVVQVDHPWLTILAQNLDGCAALVVQTTLPPNLTVGDGRGFSVKTVRAGVDDFVRISSKETGLPPLFLKFIEFVLSRSADAESAPAALVGFVEAVDQFRRFGSRPAGRLSEEEIRGLFAELHLMLMMEHELGISAFDLLASWGGPFGGLHDLEFANGYSIEVKSTHQPPKEVRITSPAQIAPIQAGLDLVVLPMDRLSGADAAGVGFLEILDQARQLADRGGQSARDRWDLALAALDLDVADEYYRQWRFLPGSWLRYIVDEGFPWIDPALIPPGVVKVSFTLQLNALKDFAAPIADLMKDGRP